MKFVIQGEPLPVLTCEVENGERMVTQSGAMCWMSPNMQMETSGGGFGKAFGRMFTGESMFQNHYTAQGGPGFIAFAPSMPGSIRKLDIAPDRDMIIQKTVFLASEASVDLSIFFQKKLGVGFFGGEGFIMQQLSGSGAAFIEISGHAVEYALKAGQTIIIGTGHLVAMDSTCSIDVAAVPGLKNKLLGGEGLFNTVVTGPGNLILQSMPISAVAQSLTPYLPKSSS